eukprot:6069206-Lingulodinium_polyedra.AAC.1
MARVEYICVDFELPDERLAVASPFGVDLSLTAGAGHLCVAAWFAAVAPLRPERSEPPFSHQR